MITLIRGDALSVNGLPFDGRAQHSLNRRIIYQNLPVRNFFRLCIVIASRYDRNFMKYTT
jgi:hypothetical protein